MALKIRLKRVGKKRNAHFRLVVSESSMAPTGRFLEEIGTYKPTPEEAEVRIDEEKALKWLQNGARPSNTVRSLFKDSGIWADYIDSKQ